MFDQIADGCSRLLVKDVCSNLQVPLPDYEARKAIFRIYVGRMPFEGDSGLLADELAQITDGFSGAGCRRVCQEAAMLALRESVSSVFVVNSARDRLGKTAFRVRIWDDPYRGKCCVILRQIFSWNKIFKTNGTMESNSSLTDIVIPPEQVRISTVGVFSLLVICGIVFSYLFQVR